MTELKGGPLSPIEERILKFIASRCDEQGRLSNEDGAATLAESANDRSTVTYLYRRGLITTKPIFRRC
jgi:hypothetical protein